MSVVRNKVKDLHGFRGMLELAVCFLITVSVLRGFFLEGYLVSTGSMAPMLLGFHKRLQCPSCQHSFACGVQFDESVDTSSGGTSGDSVEAYASCPNCGQINIDISTVPGNHGDQLLVHKNVFDFRRPRRWEPVVFRNPASPGEAYVKRVVGLPGEQMLILDGDIYANGRIARKNLATQRSMRILVSDLGHLPDDPTWELPWQLDGNWSVEQGKLQCAATAEETNGRSTTSSLSFRNWRWFGGNHTAETPLSTHDAYPDWTDFLRRFDRIPVSWVSRLDYDEEAQVLRCQGVMPEEMQRDLMTSATNNVFRRAIYRLAAQSHLSPVTDRYGYNSVVASAEHSVADVMLDTTIIIDEKPLWIEVSVPVDSETYHVYLDAKSGRIELRADDSQVVLRSAKLVLTDNRLRIEASNFDHRVIVAVNGELPFGALDLPGVDLSVPLSTSDETLESSVAVSAAATFEQRLPRQRFTLSITGGRVRVEDLRMYRDVYYTPGRRKHAVDTTCEIPTDSYFVHGDNSPVSFDSRSWEDPFVPHRLLVGKPFVVHLPSRPGRLSLGNRQIAIRIPDFGRIRYIQ